jgi:hypothetical protein
MRQKSYHDKAKAPREFEVGNYVYLKVSPTKGIQRFGVKGKLAPRYIGPYEVTEKFGTVAYRIGLPDRLSAVHDVFHVLQLKKCEQIPEAQIIEETNAEIEPDLFLAEYPMRVLDHKERQTRRQKVKMYKIQWSHHTEEEATWETEQFLNTKYPDFLASQTRVESLPVLLISNLGTRFPLRGVGCNTSCFCSVVFCANEHLNTSLTTLEES